MRLACIGECMIELSDAEAGLTRSFGGDTLNTAIYAARTGRLQGLSVDYVTALGDDPYSAAMLAAWADEGVGTETVRRMPGRMPGLYMIRTAGEGERSFYYWRSAAAAKEMFDGADGAKLAARLRDYDWIYFSGITLGVLTLDGALVLFEALRQAHERNK